MIWSNYHSHCNYCDGETSAESYIAEAIRQGMHAYGFSSHAPLPVERPWAMKREALPDYIQHLLQLRHNYRAQIQVYLGLEIDYLPGVSWWDFYGSSLRSLDYMIGSVHLVEAFEDGTPWEVDGSHDVFQDGLNRIFKGDVRAAVSRYFELTRWMVMLENPDIVGHLDKIKIQNAHGHYFSETDEWYRREIDKTLKVISNMGSIIEVNTRGLYSGKCLDLYPSQWILERILAMKIPITLNADTHKPGELTAGFEFAARILQKIGFRELYVLDEGRWKSLPFDEAGLRFPFGAIQTRPA